MKKTNEILFHPNDNVNETFRFTFIGAGNVACNLGLALKKTGHIIWQVYSRTNASLEQWPLKTELPPTTDLKYIDTNAHVYIIAITDDSIQQIAQQLHVKPHAIVVHTSGTAPMNYLSHFKLHGIFYPLQTFSRTRFISLENVPFILDSNNSDTLKILQNIVTHTLHTQFYLLNEQQRQYLHIAAVFANNFTNYLNIAAAEILAQKQIPFELLHSLIKETALKVCEKTPAEAQTGPAKRGDESTLQKHLHLLKQYPPHFSLIYSFLSKQILDKFGHNSSKVEVDI